ncbi:hypothetical protein AAG906_031648 [Vitis piasezkii]|uniref:Uncharacterized protein n=2 Tax=Vitis vinifera TaxID=29760 RepID=A0A438ECV2_VITVI|nr:uncharacterized protein LOC104878977 [Vitis vinifera]XP_034701620.1 uncharacterized protein LOC117926564 [Vitis riparia]RVW45482.1 hypothetical protein CK203_079771 [Vitis vinifera]RVW65188.1 hypothetical protein CK203_035810 [Vitis vinifera]WJZ80252.1 hypothetical protein VitviT2T_000186 [Vitis vinifera]|eukprot:XP_010648309.1 PREDICTED: uncharacterized protein LOC104878977 [Vitis vinifera]
MKERGKAVETYGGSCFADYYSTSDLPCRKHPSSSSVGICAYCLKDRLIKLVCSDCGEQRLSSCSCSEISSIPNSCTVEVGSVGRISFLIENERGEVSHSNSKLKSEEKSEQVVLLKRSSSSSVEIKRSRFWGIGRLFRKKRDKGFDDKSEGWMFDYMGVSRSRSLCSFRGGGYNESEDGDLAHSHARTSGVNGALPFDLDKKSGFSEEEARRSGFSCPEKKDYDALDSKTGLDFKAVKKGSSLLELETRLKGAKRSGFPLKESDFSGLDDSGFIDLKLDFSSESKPDIFSLKMGALSESGSCFSSMRGGGHDQCGGCSFGNLIGDDDGAFSNGGTSCRITVNERGIKKGRKSLKVWRWILRNHPSWVSTTARKKNEDQILKS